MDGDLKIPHELEAAFIVWQKVVAKKGSVHSTYIYWLHIVKKTKVHVELYKQHL